MLFIQCLGIGCTGDEEISSGKVDYRMEMRIFIQALSADAKNIDEEFLIIPQNGQELVTENGDPGGAIRSEYVASIDATGREDMYYGYEEDDKATSAEDLQYLLDLCLVCEQNGIEVLTTDYCWTREKIDNSYSLNAQNGFISFAADERELDKIPSYPAKPYRENANNIDQISEVRNYLYLINGSKFNTKQDFIAAVAETNYDLIIMDLFQDDKVFNIEEITQLKVKANGGTRLVICYMSIGEAEDYRFYWRESWRSNPPAWLEAENPAWVGNFKVKYWETDWQDIIYGNANSYLSRILDAGFDGVYLDIVEGYEYFEEN